MKGEIVMARTTNKIYRELAKTQYHREGEIEIDDNAKVSRGDDPGAYVQAWVWIPDPNAKGGA
jgi:hypothetical protein